MITIRPAEPSEYDAVGRVCLDAYEADGQFAVASGYPEILADVAARAAVAEVLVAVDQAGAVVGTVTFVLPGTRLAEVSGPEDAEFRMLAVAPAAQGQGIGEALVRACLDRAEAHGAAAVVLCVRDISAPAMRLYGRLGFVRWPERDGSPVPGVRLLAMRLGLSARSDPGLPRARRPGADRR